MKVALVWVLLTLCGLLVIAVAPTIDRGESPRSDAGVMVVGKPEEVSDDVKSALGDPLIVSAIHDIPDNPPDIILVTPSGASSAMHRSLRPLAIQGVGIGGLNVDLADLWTLTGHVDELLEQGGASAFERLGDATWKGKGPFYSFMWTSCGVDPDGQGGFGTLGSQGGLDGPLGDRGFRSALEEVRALSRRCAVFDQQNIPTPQYRMVVIGNPAEIEALDASLPAEALYVATADDVPTEDVALVVVTRDGRERSLGVFPQPLQFLRHRGIPLVGLDIDLAEMLELTGIADDYRQINAGFAADELARARWSGQRPVYSYISRPCPLTGELQSGQGQAWVGGLGAAPETPPLSTLRRRLEDLRAEGSACVDVMEEQRRAYIDRLLAQD